ncbi:hypothetical protein HMH01_01545 [Halovulum dunhuangense]|uniref:Cobalamin biosynthesis protein CbiG n=1 Tax=Halovulum dunhuangense TaxID=1505036 RepID=A0A849L043_9RHOB|nr:hypothetical protein [Halovulum dunhuangense]NNU79110.1 hypothetical protein [Halovulum dunhuangense]
MTERRVFDTVLIVDWSARSSASPKRGAADAIWWAVARGGAVEKPVYVRTRAEAVEQLGGFLAAEADAGRRVLAGFDFAFGYPAGLAALLTGRDHALALWEWLAREVRDGPDNANNRYAVAEAMNAAFDGLGPFWGRPQGWNHPGIPVRASARHGAHPPERRITEGRVPGAKSVWQLAYAGAVGSQVLLGLPALERLRNDPRLAGRIGVWPFDNGFDLPEAGIVLAEIYPSLLQREVRARMAPGQVLDAAQVATLSLALHRFDIAEGLSPLFSPPPGLSDAEFRAVTREEGWILGAGAADVLSSAL